MRSRAAIEDDLKRLQKEIEDTTDGAVLLTLRQQYLTVLKEHEIYYNDEPNNNPAGQRWA